jgi:serine/threonine-protein kinase
MSSSPLDQLQAALGPGYTLERELGRGGMATVYLATEAGSGRRVALKVLHPSVGTSVGVDRFLREIQIASSLDHPRILALLDSGRIDDVPYYVMPYVEGETLSQRLHREAPLPVHAAARS